MKWLAFAVLLVVIASAFSCLKRRRKRREDPSVPVHPDIETGFYPEIEKCHEINTKSVTCSCSDFRNEREQFRRDDPRRLCKHLVRSFIDAGSLPEDLLIYKEGIERSDREHSGFPKDRSRFDRVIAGKRVSVMVPEERGEEDLWIELYVEGRRYSYSPERDKWKSGTVPPQEAQILGFLYEKMGREFPATGSSKQPEHQGTERKPSEKGPPDNAREESSDLESVLRTLLPPDGELTLKETKNYVAVTFNGSRRWVCRLYLNARRSKSIEFPDGTRFEFGAVEEIARYQEKLLDAYRAKSPAKRRARLLFPMNDKLPSGLVVPSAGSADNPSYFSRN